MEQKEFLNYYQHWNAMDKWDIQFAEHAAYINAQQKLNEC